MISIASIVVFLTISLVSFAAIFIFVHSDSQLHESITNKKNRRLLEPKFLDLHSNSFENYEKNDEIEMLTSLLREPQVKLQDSEMKCIGKGPFLSHQNRKWEGPSTCR